MEACDIERHWHCEACGQHAGEEAAKAKLARTECVQRPATALGEHARPQCHLLAQTGSLMWCCRCGARAAKLAKKLGQPCVWHPRTQEYARRIRLLSSRCHPKENCFLGLPKLFTAQAWARWRQNLQGILIRLRMAEAQPTETITPEVRRGHMVLAMWSTR